MSGLSFCCTLWVGQYLAHGFLYGESSYIPPRYPARFLMFPKARASFCTRKSHADRSIRTTPPKARAGGGHSRLCAGWFHVNEAPADRSMLMGTFGTNDAAPWRSQLPSRQDQVPKPRICLDGSLFGPKRNSSALLWLGHRRGFCFEPAW